MILSDFLVLLKLVIILISGGVLSGIPLYCYFSKELRVKKKRLKKELDLKYMEVVIKQVSDSFMGYNNRYGKIFSNIKLMTKPQFKMYLVNTIVLEKELTELEELLTQMQKTVERSISGGNLLIGQTEIANNCLTSLLNLAERVPNYANNDSFYNLGSKEIQKARQAFSTYITNCEIEITKNRV